MTTPEGRASQLGTRLPGELDERSVPSGLLASHTLRHGTWGQIVVLEGKLDYVIEGDPALAFVLRPGVAGNVAPELPHHVRLQPGARFKVRFLR